METKKLRGYDFLTVNIFWLGLNIRNNAVGNVLMPYLVAAFVSPEVVNSRLGYLNTAGLFIAMLVQPAAGLLSDRSTSRFGRRRPFIFAGVCFDLLFLVLIGLSGNYWMLLAAVLLIQVSGNVSHGPLQGLIPDLVPEDQRAFASAVKAIFELIPIILVSLTVAPLVAHKQVGWAIFVACAGVAVTMLLQVGLVKEKPQLVKPDVDLKIPMLRVLGVLGGILAGAAIGLVAGGIVGGVTYLAAVLLAGKTAGYAIAIGFGGFIAMLVAIIVGVWVGTSLTLGSQVRQQASFTWWIVNRLLFFTAVTSVRTYAPYFLMSAFGFTKEVAIQQAANLMNVVGILTILSALPGGWLGDRLGRKFLVGLSGVIAFFGMLLLLSTTIYPNLLMIYIAGGFIGIGAGLFVVINWAMGTDLAPRDEAGRYLGISNLAGAGAGMVGTGMGGPIADTINGLFPGLGYLAIFTCYALLFLVSTASLVGIKRDSGK